jgi:hypothetical protein
MKMRRDEPMSAEAERELEALDRALAGDDVEPEFADLAALATELRAERPLPDRDWGLGLDAQAESGFGRAGKPPWRRLVGERRPMSLLAPAGALATLVVVAAVGISVSREGGDEANVQPIPGVQEQLSEEPAAESVEGVPADARDAAAEEPLGRLELYSGDADAAGEGSADVDTGYRASGEILNITEDRLARGRQNRVEDRSASLVLQTETREVREVSDQAISIVQGVGGIVVSSNLSEQGKRAAATLELSIPTRALDSTLDQLTGLATVKSLNEGSVDITKPFVSAEDALADAQAERKQLLEALGNATTDFEAEAIRKQLDDVQGEIARAEATFENIARRARLADVSLQIEGKPESDDGSWSLGEAAEDALDVLRTVAGVLLISAAILVPLGLIAAAVVLVTLWIRRRRRERALDD